MTNSGRNITNVATKYPALSYTAIKMYETCPFRYYQEKILKTVPYVQTEAAALGDRIHKELENFVLNDGNYKLSDEAAKYEKLMKGLIALPGKKYVETKMAMDWKVKKVEYFGKNVWIRGQFDFMALDGDQAKMVDYKTGSHRYPDVGQLELMSALAFLHFPELNKVDASLLFINHNAIAKASFERAKMPAYIDKWMNRSIPIVQATELREWPAKRNNLCAWCPITDCRFHPGERKGV